MEKVYKKIRSGRDKSRTERRGEWDDDRHEKYTGERHNREGN